MSRLQPKSPLSSLPPAPRPPPSQLSSSNNSLPLFQSDSVRKPSPLSSSLPPPPPPPANLLPPPPLPIQKASSVENESENLTSPKLTQPFRNNFPSNSSLPPPPSLPPSRSILSNSSTRILPSTIPVPPTPSLPPPPFSLPPPPPPPSSLPPPPISPPPSLPSPPASNPPSIPLPPLPALSSNPTTPSIIENENQTLENQNPSQTSSYPLNVDSITYNQSPFEQNTLSSWKNTRERSEQKEVMEVSIRGPRNSPFSLLTSHRLESDQENSQDNFSNQEESTSLPSLSSSSSPPNVISSNSSLYLSYGSGSKTLGSTSKLSKNFNFTKTKLLQKIGKTKITEYSNDFKEDKEQIKTLSETLKELISCFERYETTTQGFSGISAQYCKCLQSFSSRLKEYDSDSPLIQILNEFSAIQTEIDSIRVSLEVGGLPAFLESLQKFLEEDIVRARTGKQLFRRAKIQYDASVSELETVTQLRSWNLQIDWLSLFSAHTQYYYSKRKYHLRLQNAIQLNEKVLKYNKETNIPLYLIEYIQSILKYLETLHFHLYHLFRDKISVWKASSTQTRQEFQEYKVEKKIERDKAKILLEQQIFHEFVDFLADDDMGLINSINLSTSGTEQDEAMERMVKILDSYHLAIPLIKNGITNELTTSGATPQTMFRSNNSLSRFMTTFTKLNGKIYLKNVIKPLINYILQNEYISFEVDPSKLQENEDGEKNMERLIETSQYFMDTILNSLQYIPLPFREMARHLQHEVSRIFDESNRHAAVGGIIFLRFICPSILAPDKASLVDGSQLTKENRRALILISKSLQNLSNGIKFGIKEPFMNPMNVFIERNISSLHSFFDSICNIEGIEIIPSPLISQEESDLVEIPKIFSTIMKNFQSVNKHLTKTNNTESLVRLAKILGRLSFYVEPKEEKKESSQ